MGLKHVDPTCLREHIGVDDHLMLANVQHSGGLHNDASSRAGHAFRPSL